jgi:nuclear transport factor 2 (NTF2) superfamily protein
MSRSSTPASIDLASKATPFPRLRIAAGDEIRALAAGGLMRRWNAGLNDLASCDAERKSRGVLGRRPADHPGPPAVGR